MNRITIALALLVAGLVSGCDVCEAAAAVHTQRCADGDQASCEWMAENVEPTTGQVCRG